MSQLLLLVGKMEGGRKHGVMPWIIILGRSEGGFREDGHLGVTRGR